MGSSISRLPSPRYFLIISTAAPCIGPEMMGMVSPMTLLLSVVALAAAIAAAIAVSDSAGALVLRLLLTRTVGRLSQSPGRAPVRLRYQPFRALPWRFFGGACSISTSSITAAAALAAGCVTTFSGSFGGTTSGFGGSTAGVSEAYLEVFTVAFGGSTVAAAIADSV